MDEIVDVIRKDLVLAIKASKLILQLNHSSPILQWQCIQTTSVVCCEANFLTSAMSNCPEWVFLTH